MWVLSVSDGRRVADIAREDDARRAVHSLGVTERVGMYSWRFRGASGELLTAEIRHSYART